jgi:hypothetical protein
MPYQVKGASGESETVSLSRSLRCQSVAIMAYTGELNRMMSLELPPYIEQRLAELAKSRGLTESDLVRELIEASIAAPVEREHRGSHTGLWWANR